MPSRHATSSAPAFNFWGRRCPTDWAVSCLRRVELEGVKTSIVGQRGVLLPAIRHPQREGLMQIQLTCVEFPEQGRVTLFQEVEVEEEVQQQLWCYSVCVSAMFDEHEHCRHSAM